MREQKFSNTDAEVADTIKKTRFSVKDKTVFQKHGPAVNMLAQKLQIYHGQVLDEIDMTEENKLASMYSGYHHFCKIVAPAPMEVFYYDFRRVDCNAEHLLLEYQSLPQSKLLKGIKVLQAYAQCAIAEIDDKISLITVVNEHIKLHRYEVDFPLLNLVAGHLAEELKTDLYLEPIKRFKRRDTDELLPTYRRSVLEKKTKLLPDFVEKLSSLPQNAGVLLMQDVLREGAFLDVIAEKIQGIRPDLNVSAIALCYRDSPLMRQGGREVAIKKINT